MLVRSFAARGARAVLLLTLLFPAMAAKAQVLDEVETALRRDGSAGIRLRFDRPVTVRQYFPKKRGKTLYLSLRLAERASGHETVSSFDRLDGRLPLVEATFEANSAEGDRVILKFRKPVSFRVYNGRDGRSVLVVVSKSSLNGGKGRSARPVSGNLEQQMQIARRLLIKGKNKEAIAAFQRLLRMKEHKYTRDATELLGLAYERAGEIAQARRQYKLYLKRYPSGDGAERVSRRLRNLSKVTARPRLHEARRRTRPGGTSVYGSWSQKLFYGQNTTATTTTTDQTLLLSNFYMTARQRTDNFRNKAVLGADHSYDLINNISEGRLQRAYAETKLKWHNLSGRIGRQSAYGAGILGRFDGAIVGGDIFSKWRLNHVIGIPVESATSSLTSKREFEGYSMDFGTFGGHWSGSLFEIGNTIDGRVDRQAVGAELRYFDPRHTVFTLADYDTYFNDLNALLFQGYWRTKGDWSYNLMLDSRKSPFLQLGNALLGQVDTGGGPVTYNSIADLEAGEPGLDIMQLARDRTASSQLASLSMTLPPFKRMGAKSRFLRGVQIGGDLSYNRLSGLPASAGQPAIPGSESTSISARIIAPKILFRNEITVTGLSYIKNTGYEATSFFLTDRNQFNRHWRLDLGIKWYQQNNTSGTNLTRLTPSIKLEYRRKRTTFEFELGRETSDSVNPLVSETVDRDFVSLGYRFDF